MKGGFHPRSQNIAAGIPANHLGAQIFEDRAANGGFSERGWERGRGVERGGGQEGGGVVNGGCSVIEREKEGRDMRGGEREGGETVNGGRSASAVSPSRSVLLAVSDGKCESIFSCSAERRLSVGVCFWESAQGGRGAGVINDVLWLLDDFVSFWQKREIEGWQGGG